MADLTRIAKICADWWTARLQIEDKRAAFAAVLTRRIAEAAPQGRIFLKVDYDPWGMLLETVREVGIACRGFMYSAEGILPTKTSMRIYFDEPRVTVSEGYGGPFQDLNLQAEEGDRG